MTTKKRGTLHIGPLSPKNGTGQHFVPHRPDFTPPTLICNASVSSTNPLSLVKLWENSAQRPGALDFMKCKSRGFGC